MPSLLRLRRDERRRPLSESLLGCLAIVLIGHSGSLMADDVVPSFIDERSPTATREQQEQQERQRTLDLNVQQPDSAPGVSENAQVNVRHINIRGGSVFELDELAAPLKSLVGETVTVGRINKAVRRITERYQNAGYPISYAYLPADNFANGNVEVVVVEGYIARAELDIDNDAVAARVQRLIERMAEERPLRRERFERYTALIERIPGASLSVNVPLPRTINGATTVRVEERDIKRVDAGLSVNYDDEDDTQTLANIATQGNTRHAERLSLAGLLPVDDDDEYLAAEYSQALGSDGLRLKLSATHFDGDDATQLRGVPIEAREDKERYRYRAGLEYPIELSRETLWEVGGAVEYLDEDTQYRYTSENGESRANESLRYGTAELNTRYRQVSDDRLWEISGDVRQGLEVGGSKNELTIETTGVSQSDDDPLRYTRLGLQGRWVEALGERWRLTTRADGFWAEDSLPVPERGNYGGTRFGRGYPDGQAEGDYGYAGEIEMRFLQAVPWGWVSRVEPYLVVDGARTRFHDNDIEYNLASAAFGLEFTDNRYYRLGVEYARPIAEEDLDTDNRDGRINARVSWQFDGG
ncbi:ShlB/FhaC/HecB family hemolysin secretion/activation protein [Chromohalobacter nigrandesensis]|uniref:ShlB/FhaC/HecB family hemolysin secretion/activation protein n=1 Tax=Chromohalobacter nigrandesensis TaxID=119863 RepID=UPI001FF48B3B|nr:POTRA domain-containing protein [Chromohalobacter nigrandesensis]MCK0743724.1 ShlB/FhaC/HecB family hemolysin secretion/activation protein [Chromohalobacter nigrandesensis]